MLCQTGVSKISLFIVLNFSELLKLKRCNPKDPLKTPLKIFKIFELVEIEWHNILEMLTKCQSRTITIHKQTKIWIFPYKDLS